MLSTLDVRSAVHGRITDLLAEAGVAARPVTGAESLHELALTSLLLARLIIELEAEIGADPFADDVVLADISCVDDLVAAYQRAAAKALV
ncbi:phosphopantetheine-binding protein [Actinokineospora inagensis]|uniref:phosphopantetheine-binding protein n=1 Tax=Actinokineospora inagensis TaxID=103730 RepID=UPI0003FBE270|nr:phosphopantetheine-binding protein [Actinokineospora inagensis]